MTFNTFAYVLEQMYAIHSQIFLTRASIYWSVINLSYAECVICLCICNIKTCVCFLFIFNLSHHIIIKGLFNELSEQGVH